LSAAVIVAAGRGSRLGGRAKALLPAPGGMTFLAAIAELARGAGIAEIVVVVGGPHRAAKEVEAARLDLAVAINPRAERGMATSVAQGFAFAAGAFAASSALLWPVDHARVAPETLAALVVAARRDGAVIPAYRGLGGHPVAVGRALWPELARCGAAPEGARSVLRSRPWRVQRIDVDDAGVVGDVDTPADLEAIA
jgi:CTP:molybdopterin cytidylyltransferase MocA